MAMKTRAAVTVGPRKVEMREIPVPETNEDTGLVRIELTGVCGVDWPAFNGSRPDRFKVPLIQGHEIVGRIERIGRKAAQRWDVKDGDRVVSRNTPRAATASIACRATTTCAVAK